MNIKTRLFYDKKRSGYREDKIKFGLWKYERGSAKR